MALCPAGPAQRGKAEQNAGVAVRSSQAVPGELGLFAQRHFRPRETIGHYSGTVYRDPAKVPRDRTYVAYLVLPDIGACWVDGRDGTCLNRINDARNTGMRNNARLLKSGRVIATRAVAPGDEILMPYGSDYWRGRRV